MRIGVLLRQVPDPEGQLELAPEGDGVVEGSAPWVLDECDEAALDAALTLAADVDEVVAIVLGPERAEAAARKALALGATRAVRLGSGSAAQVDEESADRGALARRVAAAVRAEAVDLLLAGAQTSSVGSGLLASACAVACGWPWVWLALEVTRSGGDHLEVVQELEAGRRRRWRVRPPAVLAVQTGRYQARMPTIRGVLAAKRATIDVLAPGIADAVLEPEARREPARLERIGLARPAAATGVEWVEGAAGEPAGAVLVRRLREEDVL